MVSLMIGRAVDDLFAEPPPPSSHVVLSVQGLSGEEVEDLTFEARAGEIVGFAGILGSGREEVSDLLFGAKPTFSGSVTVNGAVSHDLTPAGAMALGMGMVPSDRGSRGALSTFSITENMTITRLRGLCRGGRIRRGAERAEARTWVETLDIRPGRIEAALGTLSGGNQQKVILAKWLRTDPTVLILDEPTHGVDVGAKAAIYQLIADRARDGLAVVVCSTESEELAHVCDRVLVLRDGQVVSELEGPTLTADRITREALGSPSPSTDPIHSEVTP
jgi:ribose transport system ATP-binding protein